MGSATASLLRPALLAACRAAFLTEVANVAGWDVEDARALATGSAGEIRARRLITGCWFRLAHHSPSPRSSGWEPNRALWDFSRRPPPTVLICGGIMKSVLSTERPFTGSPLSAENREGAGERTC